MPKRLFFLLLLSALAIPSLADDFGFRPVSSIYSFWGEPWAVTFHEGYAYVSYRPGGLVILDVTEPDQPQFVRQIPSLHAPERSTFWNGFLYLIDQGEGLIIYDLSNPSEPAEVGRFETQYFLVDIVLKDTIAFLPAVESGVLILDVSNPAEPEQISRLRTGSIVGSVAVNDTLLFVDRSPAGFQVWNISDLANPSRISTYGIQAFIYGMACSDGILFISFGRDSFRSFDITNPANVQQIGLFPFGDYITGFQILDRCAFLETLTFGMRVLDISDPQAMESIGFDNSLRQVNDISFEGDYGVVAAQSGVYSFDRTNPNDPTRVGQFELPGAIEISKIVGDRAYVSAGDAGFRVVNINNLAHPVELAVFDLEINIEDMEVRDGYAYLACGSGGLKILNVNEPLNDIRIVAESASPHRDFGITLSGNYAYIACYDSSLRIVNIEDPETPFEVGRVADRFAIRARDVAVRGNLVYVAAASLVVFNISDPASPFRVGYTDTPDGYGVALGDSVVCMSTREDLTICTLANPQSPRIVQHFAANFQRQSFAVEGTHVWLAADGAVTLLDIANPRAPVVAGRYTTGGVPMDVSLADEGIIAVANQVNMLILDCTEALDASQPITAPMPSSLFLNSCYPNPFNGSTTILFSVAKSTSTRLTVYNTAGRIVDELVNGTIRAGEHSIIWNAEKNTGGIYLLRLEQGDEVETMKVVLMK